MMDHIISHIVRHAHVSIRRSASDATSLNPFLSQQQLEDMSEDDVPNMENIKLVEACYNSRIA